MKQFLYFMLGFLISVFIITSCDKAFGQALYVSGGLNRPHSETSKYSLEPGPVFSVAIDDALNDWFKLGGTFIHSAYEKQGRSTSTVHSYSVLGYGKFYHRWSDFEPYLIAGFGGQNTDTFSLVGLMGVGIKTYWGKHWSVGTQFSLMRSDDKLYRLNLISVGYEF